MMFKDKLTFQLVGSLSEKPASYHDADIVVYPRPGLRAGIQLAGFIRACKKSGVEIIEIDRDSTNHSPEDPKDKTESS